MYFMVQFIKMLILATFFPETESENLDVVGVRISVLLVQIKRNIVAFHVTEPQQNSYSSLCMDSNNSYSIL